MDDRDETIPDLAELLLSLAQIVVFIVDYRYVSVQCNKRQHLCGERERGTQLSLLYSIYSALGHWV